MNIAVITTFPNNCFDIYAKKMLKSFVKYWPSSVALLVQLDDELLADDVQKLIRPQDGIVCGRQKDHNAFVERNKDKESQDYRKQAVRFSHKVFALKHAADSVAKAHDEKIPDAPRYLIWMDADVITHSPVNEEQLTRSLPKEGDAVSYLGRKDWDHSECGWLAFDFDNGGKQVIDDLVNYYVTDNVFKEDQWHDSYLFDQILAKKTNLTEDKAGMDIWPQSPMGEFSTHFKGPQAKHQLMGSSPERSQPVTIVTKNSIPDEKIKSQIAANQKQIKQWVSRCLPNDEAVVVVSAGPMMTPEDLIDEIAAGRRIVAVKHALKRLKDADIKPWACILLDPREHVYDFVQDPDTDIIWFVASQVHPTVVEKLLESGCNVWGYHAPVGAGEFDLFQKQPSAVIPGGSASATRGLHLLESLGFRKYRLYGYDLCHHKKPDMNSVDANTGSPKYLSMTIGAKSSVINMEKDFWTEGQLAAQIQELKDLIDHPNWDIDAFGFGVMPFLVKTRKINNLREKAYKAKMLGDKPQTYEQLLWTKEIKRSMPSHKESLPIRRKRKKANSL